MLKKMWYVLIYILKVVTESFLSAELFFIYESIFIPILTSGLELWLSNQNNEIAHESDWNKYFPQK